MGGLWYKHRKGINTFLTFFLSIAMMLNLMQVEAWAGPIVAPADPAASEQPVEKNVKITFAIDSSAEAFEAEGLQTYTNPDPAPDDHIVFHDEVVAEGAKVAADAIPQVKSADDSVEFDKWVVLDAQDSSKVVAAYTTDELANLTQNSDVVLRPTFKPVLKVEAEEPTPEPAAAPEATPAAEPEVITAAEPATASEPEAATTATAPETATTATTATEPETATTATTATSPETATTATTATSPETATTAQTPETPAATTAESVQALIDALPAPEDVNGGNSEQAMAQFTACNDAIVAFIQAGGTEDQLDLSRFDALSALLSQPSIMSGSDVYWNPNPENVLNPDGSVRIHAGSDTNDGSTADYPVLTWAKARQQALSGTGTIIVMSVINLNDNKVGMGKVTMLDGTDTSGNPAITLQQYAGSLEEMFLVAPNCQLTMKNINIKAADGLEGSTIIRLVQAPEGSTDPSGKLILGENLSITGEIQFETNAGSQSNMGGIEITPEFRKNPPADKLTIYCSDINNNQIYDRCDIIYPTTESATNLGLLDYFSLSKRNTDEGWTIRKHLNDNGTETNSVQLYRLYHYTAVYVDGQNGNDAAFGGNCEFPVKTFARAKDIILNSTWDEAYEGKRVMYICDTIDVTAAETWSFSEAPASYNVKVVSCPRHPLKPNDSGSHGAVVNMVNVKDGGSLTTDHIFMLHGVGTSNYENTNVYVSAGGTYTMNEGTVLTAGISSSLTEQVTYGRGITVAGAAGKTTTVSINGATDTTQVRNHSQGVKVTGVSSEIGNTKVAIAGGSITKNNQSSYYGNGNGAGVSVSYATLDITGGSIDNNYVRAASSGSGTYTSYSYGGGGIYARGSAVNMSAGTIDSNTSYAYSNGYTGYRRHGAGIYADAGTVLKLSGTASITNNVATGAGGGVFLYNGARLEMTGGTIDSNASQLNNNNNNFVNSIGGGGIAAYSASINMSGGTVSNNTSTASGGGISCYNASSGTFGTDRGLNVTGGTIKNNVASVFGGGIATQDTYVGLAATVANAEISGNKASNHGGGIWNLGYLNVSGTTSISGNTTSSCGGGLYTDSSSYLARLTGTNVSLDGNTAAQGGGAYVASGAQASGVTYGAIFDGTKITNNTATAAKQDGVLNGGGGVYTASLGNAVLKGGAVLNGNTATSGVGDSLYSTGFSSIVDTKITDASATGYGVFYHVASTANLNFSAGANCVDPASAIFNTKIWLDNPASKLTLLNPVSTTDVDKLPISVNDDPIEGFTVGSIVLTNTYGSIKIDNTTYDLSDAAPYYKYFKGGSVPAKTQLAGFNKNIVLIGEGVYIDGQHGDDNNDGLSPATAVKTWAKAREILGQQVTATQPPSTDPDGFEPYIYVCGKVDVTGTETWNLDPEATDLKQVNNTTTPQLKRFASYNGKTDASGDQNTLVEVKPGGTLNVDKVLIDDNMYGIDTSVPGVANNTCFTVSGGALNINEGTTMQNTYGSAINCTSGATTMSGESLITKARSSAVLVSGDATFTMKADTTSKKSPTINMDAFVGTINSVYSAHGINVSSANAKVYLKDDSQIVSAAAQNNAANARPGIMMSAGKAVMSENASIKSDVTYVGSYGRVTIYGTDAEFIMNNNSSLTSNKLTGAAVYGTGITFLSGTGGKATMNDNAQIKDVQYGVYCYGGSDHSFTMNGKSSIHGITSDGVFFSSYSGMATSCSVTMDGESRMYDIGQYGIRTEMPRNASSGGSHTITLKGHSLIGSTDTAVDKSCGSDGIFIYGDGTAVNMSENASIAGNKGNGVQFQRYNSSSNAYGRTSNALTMSGSSSITNNSGNGVLTADPVSYPDYRLTCAITMSDSSKIDGNALRGVYLTKDSTLSVGAGAAIEKNKSAGEYGAAVYAVGKVNIDAAATIDKEIFMVSSDRDITLSDTTSVGPTGCYDFSVGYGPSYIGAKLIEPDTTSVTDATAYYDVFNPPTHYPQKADGYDNDYGIIKKADGCIWVLLENNVYIAGDRLNSSCTAVPGNDANNGSSVGSPVRTWARALEVLATLQPGANIIVCNYAVTPQSTDTTWSLPAGGVFTNTAGESWKPLVVRYKDYLGSLISGVNYGQSLTFNNITFDGNADNMSDSKTGPLVYRGYNAGSITMNGCTLQNAYTNATWYVSNSMGIPGTSSDVSSVYPYAAAIASTYGTITLNDTVITNCRNDTALNYGGLVMLMNTSFSIDGCSFTENDNASGVTATRYGAILDVYSSTGTINDTQITNNDLVVGGNSVLNGMVSVRYGSSVSFTGSTSISNNTLSSADGANATVNGLGLCDTANSASLETTLGAGVSISGNTADAKWVNGLGVYKVGQSPLTINGATISGNSASAESYSSGGGMYISGGTTSIASGTITDNHATRGAAIYYLNSNSSSANSVLLRGGTISGNSPVGIDAPSRDAQAAVFVNGYNFQIKGGGSVVDDYIYLTSTRYPITLSGSIYQVGRKYKIDLGGTDFVKGSVVVKPDGDVITNATQYLRYFEAAKDGYILDRGSGNDGDKLVLKACIFIDTLHGSDSNHGTNPDDAVASFARAKELGMAAGTPSENHDYVIFVSGPVYPNGTENWTLPDSCSMVRYSGFPVSAKSYDAYTGPMVVLDDEDALTLGDTTNGCNIYGRREIDTINGESVFQVGKDATLNVVNADIELNSTLTKGAFIDVKAGGTANVSGGTMKEGDADKGSAIFVDAVDNGDGTFSTGTLNMSGTPKIEGTVYLNGVTSSDEGSAYINAAVGFAPAGTGTVSVDMANPYNGRAVALYPDGTNPSITERDIYSMSTDITAVYSVNNRATDNDMFELQQKGFVYVDGINGLDTNDGRTPDTSVKTLKRAYEILKNDGANGGLITVVDTVTIDGTGTGPITLDNIVVGETRQALYTDNSGTIDAGGAVYIRRYSQPTAHESLTGYKHATNTAPLFVIQGTNGTLNLGDVGAGGVTIDGHANDVTGINIFQAPGVKAQAPLVEVQSGGTLCMTSTAKLINNNNAATDGKGGAVLINGGTFDEAGGSILGCQASKGSAVYQNGTYKISRQPTVEGEVYLTGDGTVANSKYITVSAWGFRPNLSTTGKLNVIIEDPYNGREVVAHPEDRAVSADERALYQLETSVTDKYLLWNRANTLLQPHNDSILELQWRPAVYIDGVNGSDANDGISPDTSVKTLKQAYTLLKTWGYGTLYVVDTVTLDAADTFINKTTYMSGNDTVQLAGPDVVIQRYVRPDAWNAGTLRGFTHATNDNTLFNVAASATFATEDIIIDGHRDPVTGDDYSEAIKVKDSTKTSSALITTQKNGALSLGTGTILRNNDNTKATADDTNPTFGYGGAVFNEGIMTFTDATFTNNSANKGSGVYQRGSLTFVSGTEGYGAHELYLATDNTGTISNPVWGADHWAHVQDTALKDNDTYKFSVNLDNPVRGRNIVTYDLTAAFAGPTVMSESPKYVLGDTVPSSLKLSKLESPTERDTIELMNYLVTYHDTDATGGTAPTDSASPYVPGTNATVLGNTGSLVKTDSSWLCWNTEEDGTGTMYVAGNTIAMNQDVDLYPVWMQTQKVSAPEVTGELRPGQELTYTINVTFPVDTTNVKVEDAIPTGTTYVAGSVDTSGTFNETANKVEWDLSETEYTAGDTISLSFKVKVNDTIANGTDVTNQATIKIGDNSYTTSTTTDTVSDTFDVTYNGNGNTSGDVPVDGTHYLTTETPTVLGNVGQGDEPKPLAKENSTFMGWNTMADGTGTHYDATDTLPAMTADVTLYAMWTTGTKGSIKSDASTTTKPGEELTYTITIMVPEAANTVSASDVIPTHTTFKEGSITGGGTYDKDTNTITWNETGVAAGTTLVYKFTVTIDKDAAVNDEITNTASFKVGDNDFTTNTDTRKIGETYTVTYDGNGNTSGNVPLDEYDYGDDQSATVLGNIGQGDTPEPLVKTDHTFGGWNTAADGSGTHYDAGESVSMAKGDVTLYAMWVGNAKTADSSNPDPTKLRPGQELPYTITVTAPEATETFVVTDTIPTGTTYVDGSVTEGGTFDSATGKITWDFGAVAAGTTKTMTFKVTVDGTLTAGTTVANTAEITIGENGHDYNYTTPNVTEEVGETHNVIYDANGGAGDVPVDSTLYLENMKATVLGNVGTTPLTKDGFTFAGWNTEADGSGTHYDADATITMGTADVTLYAMWVGNAKTATTPEPGTLRPSQELTYTINVSAPEKTETFVVTDTIPTGTTYVDGSATEGGTFDSATGKITWDLGAIDAGTAKTLEFKVTVSDTAQTNDEITNTAGIEIGENGHDYDYTTSTTTDKVTETHKVTYDANGATGDVPVDGTHYLTTETATVLGNVGTTPLTMDNSTFMGWNTKADGTGTHYGVGDTTPAMTADMTLYAMWATGTKGSIKSDASATTKPGETLTYTITIMVPEHVDKVVVSDSIPAHTTYVAGSATAGAVLSNGVLTWTATDVAAGTTLVYTFEVVIDETATVGTTIENTAKYEIGANGVTSTSTTNTDSRTIGETYTVTYIGNGNTGGIVPVDSYDYGIDQSATVLDNIGQSGNPLPLVKTDFVFDGWNTRADGTGTHYDPSESVSMANGDVTLYAMWVGAGKVVKQPDPNELRTGSELTYTIDVTVPEKSDSVIVTDVVPSGTAYVEGSASHNGTYADGKVSWNLGAAEAGTSYTLTFKVVVTTEAIGTAIDNTAVINIGKDSVTRTFNTTKASTTVTAHALPQDNGNKPTPKTGDATDMAPLAIMGVMGAALIAVVVTKRRRDK